MMRSHIDTHPSWDFAIGYKRPAKRHPQVAKLPLCEDCRQRPSRPPSRCCYGCGKARERAFPV